MINYSFFIFIFHIQISYSYFICMFILHIHISYSYFTFHIHISYSYPYVIFHIHIHIRSGATLLNGAAATQGGGSAGADAPQFSGGSGGDAPRSQDSGGRDAPPEYNVFLYFWAYVSICFPTPGPICRHEFCISGALKDAFELCASGHWK